MIGGILFTFAFLLPTAVCIVLLMGFFGALMS